LIKWEIWIEASIGQVTPPGKQSFDHSSFIRHLKIAGWDYLVGVHIIERQWNDARGKRFEWVHKSKIVLGSVIRPDIAVAAAVSGLARKVRPPVPCRPSKLRLLVLMAYWPGCNASPFMAIHMLHQKSASRHRLLKTWSILQLLPGDARLWARHSYQMNTICRLAPF
jgi:hypothetical protein